MFSGDARYTQPQKACACGCLHFLALTPGQVHAVPETEAVVHLPVYVRAPAEAERRDRLPVAECVQCRTRYDRLWRPVV